MLESFGYIDKIKNARAFRLYVEELRTLESFGYMERIKDGVCFGCMQKNKYAGVFRLYGENEVKSHPFVGFNGEKSSNLECFERLDRLYEENEERSHPQIEESRVTPSL